MSFPRYSAYKDSGFHWLGWVPTHWTATRLKFVLRGIGGGGTPDTDHSAFWADEGSGTPWVAIGDLSGCQRILSTAKTLTSAGLESKKLTIWPPGTLLFSMYASLGHIATLMVPAATNQAILALLPAKGVEQRYLSRWLEFLRPRLREHASSNTQDNLNAEKVKNLLALCPPLHEQAAIATFLDRETAKIDALIAEQEKLIALLAEKRQATISHAVTRGLNPDAPMKDSGVAWLGEVPRHWKMQRLKTLCCFTTSGPRGWSERITEEGSIFVQSGDLNESLGVDFHTAKRVKTEDDAEAARTVMQDGDVVVCITGAKTGNVAVCTSVPETAYINQHLCLIRPKNGTNSLFLGFSLKSGVGQTQFELSQYGLKQGLSLENVREVIVPTPPHLEQEHIANFLEIKATHFDALTSEAKYAIALLKERRNVLITAAITGQIDVRNVVAQICSDEKTEAI